MRGLSGAAISPDGRWAAFVRTVPILEAEKSEHRGHIWLVSTDGGEPFQLTNGPNGDSNPQWSPDSTCLAFVSKRGDGKGQIWIIPIGGGEAKQLTHVSNGASNPQWSSDGKRVAFLKEEKDSAVEDKRKKAQDDRIVMGVDDFKQQHLWAIEVETLDDESELLFSLVGEGSDEDSDVDKSQRLTVGDFHVSEPDWSPDGEQIVFIATPSPKADDTMFNGTVHVVDIETKNVQKLTAHTGGESTPRWSPDGGQIAYLHSPAGYGQKDLHVISVRGGASTNLTATRLIVTPTCQFGLQMEKLSTSSLWIGCAGSFIPLQKRRERFVKSPAAIALSGRFPSPLIATHFCVLAASRTPRRTFTSGLFRQER